MDGVKSVILTAVVLASLAAVGCAAVGGGIGAPDLERRAHALNKTIMCPLCPGESIDQSQNPLSVQMRGVVAEKLAAGWTDNQIREFFVERYGPSVLLEPPAEGFGLAAWIVPPVAFGVALAALLAALRWMSSRANDGGGASAQPRYLARLRDAVGDADDAAGGNPDGGDFSPGPKPDADGGERRGDGGDSAEGGAR